MADEATRLVEYEWCIETVELEYEDVVDLDFSDKLDGFSGSRLATALVNGDDGDGCFLRLALCRYYGSQLEGVIENWWAPVSKAEGKFVLPDNFDESDVSIPKRFKAELARHV